MTTALIYLGLFLLMVVATIALKRGRFLHRFSLAAQKRANDALQQELRLAMPYGLISWK
jgi:hypothetical protein